MIGNLHAPNFHIPNMLKKPALFAIKMSLLKATGSFAAEVVSHGFSAVDGLERQKSDDGKQWLEGTIGHGIRIVSNRETRRKLVTAYRPGAQPWRNTRLTGAIKNGVKTSWVNNGKPMMNGLRWQLTGAMLGGNMGNVGQLLGVYGLTGGRVLAHNLADHLTPDHADGVTPADANERIGMLNMLDGHEIRGMKTVYKLASMLPLMGVGDDHWVTGDAKYTLREVLGMSRPDYAGKGTSDGSTAPNYFKFFGFGESGKGSAGTLRDATTRFRPKNTKPGPEVKSRVDTTATPPPRTTTSTSSVFANAGV